MIASNSSIEAKISNFLIDTLEQNQIEDLARSCGFVQKRSKITGVIFAFLLLIETRQVKPASLNELSAKLGIHGILVSKQGIDNRFNDAAAVFMQQLTDRALAAKIDRKDVLDLSVKFNRIMIKDSTVFQLPESCALKFPGSGGGASTAGIKIQYAYDLKAKGSVFLQAQPAVRSDNTNYLKDIRPMDLCLEDLGYITHEHLQEVINEQAYFLCRLSYTASLFIKKDGQYCPVDIDRIVGKMKNGQMMQLPVYLGRKNKIPVRVIFERVPNELAAEKRRKLKTDKQNKRKGLTLGRLAFCDVNAYITNAGEDLLPKTLIRSIYSLRWQVEIVFKTWKSTFNLDKVTQMKLPRFECLNYGTLLKIVICTKLFDYYKTILWNRLRIEISEIKAMRFLQIIINQVNLNLLSTIPKKIDKILDQVMPTLALKCIKERRKGRKTPMMILRQLSLA
jgi:hypothetical protein